MNEPIGVTQIFKTAVELYKRNFKIFISISLLFAVTTVGLSKVLNVQNNGGPAEFIFFLLSTIVSSWFSMALMYTSVFLLQGKKVDFTQVLRLPQERYFYYLIVNGILVVMVMCGLFLFIVPGIYLAIIYNFSSTLCVLEKTDLRTSFLKSTFLVKGYFFNILGFFMIIAALVFTPEMLIMPLKENNPSIALAIGRILATLVLPVVMISQVGLYLRMTELKKHMLGA